MGRPVAVAVPVPLQRTFTYLWPDDAPAPQPGMRVRVPFGRRLLTGLVLGDGDEPGGDVRLRTIDKIIDTEPILPAVLLRLATFVAAYYVAPIGEVCRAMLPAGLGPGVATALRPRPVRLVACLTPAATSGGIVHELRRAPAQQRALAALRAADGRAVVSDLGAGVGSRRVLDLLAARGLIRLEEEARPPDVVAGLRPAAAPDRVLNPAQAEAVAAVREAICARRAQPFLLHGVTGSGKTEVYLQAAATALECGRGVLVLVPEIGLTPALVGTLSQRFGGRLAVLHSGLTPAQRRAHWHRISSGEATIVVGARSAIFAPLPETGLIVVDEEQETAFKQEESPRYHARDLALVRGDMENCPVLLASATPSLESHARAAGGKSRLLSLPQRVSGRALPDFEIIDLRDEFRRQGRMELLSRPLVEALQGNHRSGGQAMLLLNRRGWAAFLLCRACGDPPTCTSCSVSLTLHRRQSRLLCHYCGHHRDVPRACPSCGEQALHEMGAGTERVEDELSRLLPELRVLRMDADTVRRQGGHARILGGFAAGQADLLLGTQMIAKGHDFPGVTLVGILGGDAILGLPDFRAAEWTFNLATQAAGRAGRGDDPGKVLLQAFRADHYALVHARQHDFEGFARQENRFRQALLYPPHVVLAAVRVQHQDFERGLAAVRDAAALIRADADAGEHLRILGPAPAPLARLRGRYRFHLLLKARSRRRLGAVLSRLSQSLEHQRDAGSRVTIDVDPVSLL